MNKKFLFSLSVTGFLGAVIGFTAVAHAAPSTKTKTATIAVSATVNGACRITGGTVAFGVYDPTATTATTASGTVVVACTKGTTYTVGLDTGSNSNSNNVPPGSTRAMFGGTDYLGYDLYQDSANATLWTNTSPGWVSGTGAGGIGALANQTLTVYGAIPVDQFVTPSSYTDTVTATISY